MDRILINKKKQLLSILKREEYYAILRFLEFIYLSSYDLKIFKARKMSNLYLALKELLLAEDGGRVKKLYDEKFVGEEKDEPIIIADWALDYLDVVITKKEINKVLLIDDIIIHGRTLGNLYDLVCKKYDGVKIDVKTYAKNINDYLDHPAINNAVAEDVGTIEKCRKYSQIFVDVFMVMNQPYTSYVPNIAVKQTENNCREDVCKRELNRFISWMNENGAVNNSYDDVKVKMPFYETRVWSNKGEFNNFLFTSIRTYLNNDSNQVAVVPMVSIRPIAQDVLRNQLETLAKWEIFNDPYTNRWLNANEEGTEMGTMDYRAMVYSVSTLWGRYFFAKENQFESLANSREFELFDEEDMNFGGPLLNRNTIRTMCTNTIQALLKAVEGKYKSVDNKIFIESSEHINKLNTEMNNILKESPIKKTRKDWEQIIREFLHRDSEEDEKQWKEYCDEIANGKQNNEMPKRIPGLPIVMIIEKAKSEGAQVAFEEILKAIDHGEGSIVPEKVVSKNREVYFVSSLHAGEQNYKYMEQKYYAQLYGMCQIEKNIERKRLDTVRANKLQTAQKAKLLKRLGMNNDKFLSEYATRSVTAEYGSALDSDFYMHVEDENLAKVITEFYDLTGS